MNALDRAAVRAAPSRLRILLLESWYQFLGTLRMPAFALPTLLFPAVFYAFFAIVMPGSEGRAAYLLATYGVFGVIGPALFGFGAGVAIERQSGWLRLKRVSPMPLWAYFGSKLAMSLLFGLLVALLLSALGVGFGGVRMPVPQWLALMGVLLAGTLPFCALGLLIGACVRAQAAIGVVNLVYMPMALLSGLWMPLFLFPQVLQDLAVVWPAWHLAQIALGVLGLAEDANLPLHALVLAGFTAVLLWLAARRLRHDR